MAAQVTARMPGRRANPYDDPALFGRIYVGGILLPGIVLKLSGHEKPEEWSVQKATEKTNATTVWKGKQLAENIVIELALTKREHVDAYYAVRDLLSPQQVGKKPPSLSIVNPLINFSGIARVSVRKVGPLVWVGGGGAGYWTGEIELIEYNPPKPANTGPAAPAKPDAPGQTAPDPNDIIRAQIDAWLPAAKSL